MALYFLEFVNRHVAVFVHLPIPQLCATGIKQGVR